MDLKKETFYVPEDVNIVNIAHGHALKALNMQARLEGYDNHKDFLIEQRELGISYPQSTLNALHGVHTDTYLEARAVDELEAETARGVSELEIKTVSERRAIRNTWGIRAAGLAAVILFSLTAPCYDKGLSQMPQYTMAEIDQNPVLLLP